MGEKVDRETLQVLEEGQAIQEFISGPGWERIKNILQEKIMDLQSVMNIDAKDSESVIIDINARKLAVSILMEFISDVEGRAEQHQSNKNLVEGDHFLRS